MDKLIYQANDRLLLPSEKVLLNRGKAIIGGGKPWFKEMDGDNDYSAISVLNNHGFTNIFSFQGIGQGSTVIGAIDTLLKEKSVACALLTDDELDLLSMPEERTSTVKKLDAVFKRFGLNSFRCQKGFKVYLSIGQPKSNMEKGANFLLKHWQFIQQ